MYLTLNLAILLIYFNLQVIQNKIDKFDDLVSLLMENVFLLQKAILFKINKLFSILFDSNAEFGSSHAL